MVHLVPNHQGYTNLPPPANDTDAVQVKLYNLNDDETEHYNVAPNNPKKVEELQARIAYWSDAQNGFIAPQPQPPLSRDMLPSLPVNHNGTWAPWK